MHRVVSKVIKIDCFVYMGKCKHAEQLRVLKFYQMQTISPLYCHFPVCLESKSILIVFTISSLN